MSQHGARDVGEMGESTLELWCASVGITANRVQRDKTGWDHFLELPGAPDPVVRGGALDQLPPTPKCLVQVKATYRSDTVVPVSLANLHRLVTCTLPSFYLLLQFGGSNEPLQAYLMHCDRSLAAIVLKRLRELSPEGNALGLMAKRKLNLRFRAGDALAGAGGVALLERLMEHIGPDCDLYSSRKRHWVRTVGYEQGYSQVAVTFERHGDARTARELWIDFTLGLVPELAIVRAEVRDVRFGIPSPHALSEFAEGGTLRLSTPGKLPACIVLRVENGRTFRIDGHVMLPFGVDPEATPHDFKVRFVSTFAELIAFPLREGAAAQFDFALPGGDSICDLREIARVSQFILAYAEDFSSARKAAIALEVQGTRLIDGVCHGSLLLDRDLRSRCEAAIHAWELFRAFDLDDNVSVLLGELLEQQQVLGVVRTVVLGDPEVADIQVGVDNEIADLAEEVCAPMAFAVRLGQSTVIVGRAYFGILIPLPSPHTSGKTHRLGRVRVRQFRTVVVPKGERLPYSRNELLDEMAAELGVPGQILKYWK